ncbi:MULTISPECIES: DUF2798 domain-containing protein [unclassified Oceanobacter]|uniref:DUF2798 domain-containing protein n=1 Tax=unclassified Oceanobacter TaxID=2620260 RepID=UPI0026E4761F|nr:MULTISPECIES: DUF2798 domain-containing protein [unclassified Oceanobacter]MDO6682469.1 DUF2798 domain-containing protein [Oceanobacter sp. 5_MG-2023]MDP2548778.1 DUF2798 domain-containing protein [Oceanobacter sp. 4_MG-2023]
MNTRTAPDSLAAAPEKTLLLYKILTVLAIMSVIGGSLTAVMTYMNVGYSDDFLAAWRGAFLSALVIMPVGILLMGLVSKLIGLWLPNKTELTRNLLAGSIMACLMESILAFSTAVNTTGFADNEALLHGWLDGFLAALPLGLVLMLMMSLTIKPKLERFLKS